MRATRVIAASAAGSDREDAVTVKRRAREPWCKAELQKPEHGQHEE